MTFKATLLSQKVLGVVALSVFGLAGGCAHHTRAVRGDDEPGLDYAAMSTTLDRRDLQKMLNENMEKMRASPVVQRWMSENRPAVSVLPMKNETTEHIDGPLQALISDVETNSRYFVTGKVYTTDERVGVQRRVQYYMFMQVIDVETGEILFQNKSAVTKAIVRD